MEDLMNELKDVISNGVAVDIFTVDQCISLLDEIGSHTEVLNSQGFGNLFGSLQGYLTQQIILAITKTFEQPKKKYPIRSIPRALEILERDAEKITITDRQILKKRLLEMGACRQYLKSKTDSELTKLLVSLSRKEMPSVDTDNTLLSRPMNALKAMRDKQIAHHEVVVEDMEQITWKEIDSMLTFAKKTVTVIGIAYLSTYYEIDNKYILMDDAKKASKALNQLFRKAKLIPDNTS